MINPSITRIILAFEVEIDAQKAADKIGLKGSSLMAEALQDSLRSFLQDHEIEKCECCGEYSEDCDSTENHDAECQLCRDEANEMEDTYKILRQVR
jgi:hypothetical protein